MMVCISGPSYSGGWSERSTSVQEFDTKTGQHSKTLSPENEQSKNQTQQTIAVEITPFISAYKRVSVKDKRQ